LTQEIEKTAPSGAQEKIGGAGLWLRSLLFTVLYWGWTFLFSVLGVWLVLLPRRYLMAALRGWEYSLNWLERNVMGITFEVKGMENLPEGPCIIAAKHESAWETCKLHQLFGDPCIVLKKELTRVPVWGWYAKATDLIPIDRSGHAKTLGEMQRAAEKAKAEGRKIIIFPQGTRVLPGVRKPYKIGVVALYQQLQIPIVPVALNSGLFWPKGRLIKKPGKITIEMLPPIPAGLSRGDVLRRLTNAVETASDRLAGIAPSN